MEKMPMDEQVIEPAVEFIEPAVEKVEAGEPEQKVYKWIKDMAVGTKKCENCGAVMRGWAFREPFNYCPRCGEEIQE